MFYKIITWLISHSEKAEKLLEGEPFCIVKDGLFHLKNEKDNTFSRMEIFAELRNLNIEHLVQVRQGLLEVDGTLSVLFYPNDQVKWGLPLFPFSYKEIETLENSGPYVCMYCGAIKINLENINQPCNRCERKKCSLAMTKRIT